MARTAIVIALGLATGACRADRTEQRASSCSISDTETGMVLHTTLVVIGALTVAFHEPWNPRREC